MTPNIRIEKKGKDLVIVIKDVESANFGPSKTAKSDTLASTYGNTDISADVGRPNVRLGLNLYQLRAPASSPKQ